jgi:hypothetical protein
VWRLLSHDVRRVVRNAADEALKTLQAEDADKARVDREARVLLALGHVFQVGGLRGGG